MMRKMYPLIFVLSCFLHGSYTSVAPFLRSCKLNNEDCLLTANMQIAFPYIAEGIPEIGVATTDPMTIENITLTTGEGNLKLILPTLTVEGGRRCRVVEFKQNNKESTLTLTLECPLFASGTYKFSGKLSIFNFDREGDYRMQTDAMRTTITSKFEKIAVDGKKYWKLLNYDYITEPTETLHIDLDNLFSGDIGRVQPIFGAINQEWASVAQISDPIAQDIVKNVYEALKAFLLKVSIDEILYS